jgi:hypothetical protein
MQDLGQIFLARCRAYFFNIMISKDFYSSLTPFCNLDRAGGRV